MSDMRNPSRVSQGDRASASCFKLRFNPDQIVRDIDLAPKISQRFAWRKRNSSSEKIEIFKSSFTLLIDFIDFPPVVRYRKCVKAEIKNGQ